MSTQNNMRMTSLMDIESLTVECSCDKELYSQVLQDGFSALLPVVKRLEWDSVEMDYRYEVLSGHTLVASWPYSKITVILL
jgi:hypothetical protein